MQTKTVKTGRFVILGLIWTIGGLQLAGPVSANDDLDKCKATNKSASPDKAILYCTRAIDSDEIPRWKWVDAV